MPKKHQYAFHQKPEGGVDYIGEIVGELSDTIRLQVLDAFMATRSGLWCQREFNVIRDA